jgi:hypothetical protein
MKTMFSDHPNFSQIVSRLLGIGCALILFTGFIPESQAQADPSLPTPNGQAYSGPVTIGLPFQITSDSRYADRNPKVAYNSIDQEYLVVFESSDLSMPGVRHISYQRVAYTGQLVGGRETICYGYNGHPCQSPDVAYNPDSNIFLIVYQQESHDGFQDIKGNIVDPNDPIVIIIDIAQSININTVANPAVAPAKIGSFVVVWDATWHPSPLQTDILGQDIGSKGNLIGSSYTIWDDPGVAPCYNPDVAMDSSGHELVVYRCYSGSSYPIKGRKIHPDGNMEDKTLYFAAGAGEESSSPAVAALPTTGEVDQYLVVSWYEDALGGRVIIGAMTTGSEVLSTYKFQYQEPNNHTPVNIASDLTGKRFLVTWPKQMNLFNIPFQGYASLPLPQNFQDAPPYAHMWANAVQESSVAAGPYGGFLIAVSETPIGASNSSIFGQLWGNHLYLPITVR